MPIDLSTVCVMSRLKKTRPQTVRLVLSVSILLLSHIGTYNVSHSEDMEFVVFAPTVHESRSG